MLGPLQAKLAFSVIWQALPLPLTLGRGICLPFHIGQLEAAGV